MSPQLRNRLARILRHIRGYFGHELSNQPESEDDVHEWFFEPANDLTHKVKLASSGPPDKAAQGEQRHEIVVGMTALLGITSRDALDWIVTRMLASSDPAMHSLARGLKAMWDPDKKGRGGTLDRDLQLACLVHVEILTLRASGIDEDSVLDRAVDTVLHRPKGVSPEKSLHARTRLTEIYRDNEARVQEIWLEMEAFGFH
jgi:hypothetical protein